MKKNNWRRIKSRNIEKKKELMKKGKKILERGIRIEDDLTLRERKMRWRFKKVAKKRKIEKKG